MERVLLLDVWSNQILLHERRDWLILCFSTVKKQKQSATNVCPRRFLLLHGGKHYETASAPGNTAVFDEFGVERRFDSNGQSARLLRNIDRDNNG